jgi:hypothetical protein
MSQHIATDQFDPTREDWQYQLRQLPAPEFREDDDDIRRHIRTLLKGCEQRDMERGFLTTAHVEEIMYLLEQQARRCAITGNALSCLPLQLNTMRCVLLFHTISCAYHLFAASMLLIQACRIIAETFS